MLNSQGDSISQSQQQKELQQFFLSDISQILPSQTADQNFIKIQRLQSDLQDTKQSLEMKCNQYQSLKKTNKILQSHLELQKSRITTLQQRNSELQKEVKLINKSKIKLETDKNQIQSRKQLEREFNQVVSKFQRLNENYQRLQKDNYDLKLSIEEKQKALSKSQNKFKDLLQENTKQKQQIKNKQQKQQKLNKIIQQFQDKSKKTSKIAQKQKQTIVSLQSQNKFIQSSLKQLQKQSLSYHRKEAEYLNKIRFLQQTLKTEQQNQKKLIHTLQEKLRKIESQHRNSDSRHKISEQNLNLQQGRKMPPIQEANVLNQTYCQLQGSINEYLSSQNHSRQQKVQFLNLLIFKAETQLDRTYEEEFSN